MAPKIQTGTYSADSLERALLTFERHYGLDSETFMQGHRIDAPNISQIPAYQRHTWSSFYIEWRELTGRDAPHDDPLAAQIERELEPA